MQPPVHTMGHITRVRWHGPFRARHGLCSHLIPYVVANDFDRTCCLSSFMNLGGNLLLETVESTHGGGVISTEARSVIILILWLTEWPTEFHFAIRVKHSFTCRTRADGGCSICNNLDLIFKTRNQSGNYCAHRCEHTSRLRSWSERRTYHHHVKLIPI